MTITPERAAQLQKEVFDGEAAHRLLNDPVLVAVLKDMRDTCIDGLRSSDPQSHDALTNHYFLLAVDRLEQELSDKVGDAEFSRNLLDQEMTSKEADSGQNTARIWIEPPVEPSEEKING